MPIINYILHFTMQKAQTEGPHVFDYATIHWIIFIIYKTPTYEDTVD